MRIAQILHQKVAKRCNIRIHLKYFTYFCTHLTNIQTLIGLAMKKSTIPYLMMLTIVMLTLTGSAYAQSLWQKQTAPIMTAGSSTSSKAEVGSPL